MRLVNSDYNLDITFHEGIPFILSIENPRIMTSICGNLWNQVSGGEGTFVLSDNEKQASIGKYVGYVINPFAIELNSKMAISKLYSEFKQIVVDEFYPKYVELCGRLSEYVGCISEKMPYSLEYSNSPDIISILKMMELKIHDDSDNCFERLLTYIQLSQQLLGIKLVVLMDVKQYYSVEQVKEIYKCAAYNKMDLLIIEGKKNYSLPEEEGIIIDESGCIISYGDVI